MKKTNLLKNYLRRYRKCSGLSQEDLAFLLGCRDGSKVTRYEHFSRQPSLRTALACEAILQVAAKELFAGLFLETQRRCQARARILLDRLANDRRAVRSPRRLKTLHAVLEDR